MFGGQELIVIPVRMNMAWRTRPGAGAHSQATEHPSDEREGKHREATRDVPGNDQNHRGPDADREKRPTPLWDPLRHVGGFTR